MNDISQANSSEGTSPWLQSSIAPVADRTSDRTTFNKSMSLTSSALPSEILSNLDEKICFTALEYVMTLLASQSLLALKDINLSNRNKQLIKRELSTELHIFHDWVKKTLRTDLNKSSLHRKKYGVKMLPAGCDSEERVAGNAQRNSDLFLIRNQHLNIGKTGFVAESTPIGLKPKTTLMPISNTTTTTISPIVDVVTTSTVEKNVFNGLSIVKIVEEDYVHFLSNIFTLICQSE